MIQKKIVFASFNKNKIKEVQEMLNLDEIMLLSLSDFDNKNIPEALETGTSFEENALIKARYYYNILRLPVISDDSGLVVPALKNAPGIYSARYSGPQATDQTNNDLLLKNLKSFPKDKRDAFFQAVIAYKDKRQEKIFNGKCHGIIATEPKGDYGFGYDPLFYLPELNKTYFSKNKGYLYLSKGFQSLYRKCYVKYGYSDTPFCFD